MLKPAQSPIMTKFDKKSINLNKKAFAKNHLPCKGRMASNTTAYITFIPSNVTRAISNFLFSTQRKFCFGDVNNTETSNKSWIESGLADSTQLLGL